MRAAARVFSGPFMAVAGLNHFVMPRVYAPMMPGWLPAHRELICASGAAELAAGVGTMVPATRRPAGWLLIATLVAIFPANVEMALHPERFPKIPRAALTARLPLQLAMIYWAYAATQREARS